MSRRIVIFPSLKELEELLRPPLLKQAHKWAPHGFYLVARHFGDLALAIDVAARDLLELQVASNVSVHQDLCELSRGNNKLRNKVYGIITVASKLSRWFLAGSELAIQLVRKKRAWSSKATLS